MKLIKLSETHYIVIDDSEIKEGDFAIHIGNPYFQFNESMRQFLCKDCKKITHSTEPLSEECKRCTGACEQCIDGTKQLSLSEVEEAIYGVIKTVEVELSNDIKSLLSIGNITQYNDRIEYELPFKFIEKEEKYYMVHQELMKDKLFTIEDMEKAMRFIADFKSDFPEDFLNHYYGISNVDNLNDGEAINVFIQSLLPKTEWDVEFDEQGKIKLL